MQKVAFSPRHVAGCGLRTDHAIDLIKATPDRLWELLSEHRALPPRFADYDGEVILRTRKLLREGNVELVFAPKNREAMFQPVYYDGEDQRMQSVWHWTVAAGQNSVRVVLDSDAQLDSWAAALGRGFGKTVKVIDGVVEHFAVHGK